MIYQIIDLPPNMVGFKASWEVTKEDFEEVVIPCVQKHVEKMGQLNYLLVLNTSIKNFSMGAWFKDVMMGVKHICKWRRAAIVTDSKTIKYFTGIFSLFVPGEFKGFSHEQLKAAIDWVSEATQ
ncbi:MAG TPA: STAS/SEC14 domain-containing protein [Bacteroidia bacterium]|nr:STAS/SEC14 domain-containing protein [Bacteroidia bacterium]